MPPRYLQRFLEEDDTLPVPDATFGFDDEDEDQEEARLPSLEELLEDPDVQAVLEASKEPEPVAA